MPSPARLFLLTAVLFPVAPHPGTAREKGGPPPRIRTIHERTAALSVLNVERVDRLLLPAMRKAGIDCWIVLSREGREDFVLTYLLDEAGDTGGHRNAYVFFDDGSDRLKRVAIGTHLFGTSHVFDRMVNYQRAKNPHQASLAPALRQVIEELKPRRIGVNQSRTIAVADGLTVEMRKYLEEAIGSEYAQRIVSAEPLIVDFLDTRLPGELALFREAVAVTTRIHEEALSHRVVRPGRTTLGELKRAIEQRAAEWSLPLWFPPVVSVQRAHGESRTPTTVIQPGDLVHTDAGIVYAGQYTDIQKNAYVVRAGETKPPPGLQRAFADALKVQDVIRELARPGVIGHELKRAAEELCRQRGIQGSVFAHSVAVGGHGIGAWMTPNWPDRYGVRATLPVRLGGYYAMESAASSAVPEWRGVGVSIGTEEDVVLGEKGFEYVLPRQSTLILIR